MDSGSALFVVFSARVKEAFMYSPHPLRSDDSHAVEAFTAMAQDGPLPFRASRAPHPYWVPGFVWHAVYVGHGIRIVGPQPFFFPSVKEQGSSAPPPRRTVTYSASTVTSTGY